MPSSRYAHRLLAFAVATSLLAGPADGAFADEWVDSGWQFRIPFEAVSDSIAGESSHSEFPLLVSLDDSTGAEIFTQAKPDGSDLLFTLDDGTTILEHEIVGFDAEVPSAEIWVKVPQLSPTENAFYLYYGNPDTTISASSGAAWKSSYRAVFHFADDPGGGLLTDSSPRQRHVDLPASRMWTSADTTSAQIQQGWFFNGTTHQISSRAISTQDSSYAMSAWVLNTATGSEFFMQALPDFWAVMSVLGTPGKPHYGVVGAQVSWYPQELPVNQGYHHFAWVFDGEADTIKFYFDGLPQQVRSTFPYELSPFYTGRPINPNESDPVGILGPMYTSSDDYMEGGGDEFRFHEGTLSEEWILTEYRNQKDPSSFLAFGAEESQTVTAAGPQSPGSRLFLRSEPNPFGGSTGIQYFLPRSSHVRLTVYDLSGRRVLQLVDDRREQGWHVAHWNGRTAEGGQAARGVYFLRLATPQSSRSLKVIRLN